MTIDAVEVRQRVVEDPRVGLGHADEVAVDDDPHRDVSARRPTWHTPLRDKHLVDLTARVRHHTQRHAGGVSAGERRRRSPGSAIATGMRCACAASTCAAASTSRSGTPTLRTYAWLYSSQNVSPLPAADFAAIPA